jgi:hypothetical protein
MTFLHLSCLLAFIFLMSYIAVIDLHMLNHPYKLGIYPTFNVLLNLLIHSGRFLYLCSLGWLASNFLFYSVFNVALVSGNDVLLKCN